MSVLLFGASDEARTRYLHLGKVALYQMSYTRSDESYNTKVLVKCQEGIFKKTKFLSRCCAQTKSGLVGQKNLAGPLTGGGNVFIMDDKNQVKGDAAPCPNP